MGISIRLTCPQCQTRFQASGTVGATIVVTCPKCSNRHRAKFPASAPTSVRAAKRRTQAASFDEGFIESRLPPLQTLPRSMPAPGRRSTGGSRGKLIGIVGGIVAAFALVAIVVASRTPAITTDGSAANPGSPIAGDLFGEVTSGAKEAPEDIVGGYFEMLIASEETGEHFAPEPGTPEYELRIERYLAGEQQSQDLLRRALAVDGTGQPELQQSYEQRRREFFDRYKFGTSNISDVEDQVRNDPRIADRKWKDLLKRYIDESFFGLPPANEAASSQDYVSYIETLHDFTRGLSQIESAADADGMELRLATLIDAITSYAAKEAGRNSVATFVHPDHKRAETTFHWLIDAYSQELRDQGIDSESFRNTIGDYQFAIRQVTQPSGLSGDEIIAALAEHRASRDPNWKAKQPTEPTIADTQTARSDGDQTGDTKPTDDGATGRPSAAPEPGRLRGPRPGERFDFGRRRNFDRTAPRTPSESRRTPAGGRASVLARFEGPEYLRIIIKGDGNAAAAAQDFLKEAGILGSFVEGSGGTTTVHTSDPRTPQEIADLISFGTVTAIDHTQRIIAVTYSQE